MARAGAEEEEAGEAKRGGQRDGERPDQETDGEIQLSLPDSFCKIIQGFQMCNCPFLNYCFDMW